MSSRPQLVSVSPQMARSTMALVCPLPSSGLASGRPTVNLLRIPSYEAETRVLPSASVARAVMFLLCPRITILGAAMSSGSKYVSSPRSESEMMVFPVHATPTCMSSGAGLAPPKAHVPRQEPVEASQTQTVLSALAVTTNDPLGDHAHALIVPLWPLSSQILLEDSAS